jgi:hypothetical protein
MLVAETMRYARNNLATVAPPWLAFHLDPAWRGRSRVRVAAYRLPPDTKTRQVLVSTIGQDGSAATKRLRG